MFFFFCGLAECGRWPPWVPLSPHFARYECPSVIIPLLCRHLLRRLALLGIYENPWLWFLPYLPPHEVGLPGRPRQVAPLFHINICLEVGSPRPASWPPQACQVNSIVGPWACTGQVCWRRLHGQIWALTRHLPVGACFYVVPYCPSFCFCVSVSFSKHAIPGY